MAPDESGTRSSAPATAVGSPRLFHAETGTLADGSELHLRRLTLRKGEQLYVDCIADGLFYLKLLPESTAESPKNFHSYWRATRFKPSEAVDSYSQPISIEADGEYRLVLRNPAWSPGLHYEIEATVLPSDRNVGAVIERRILPEAPARYMNVARPLAGILVTPLGYFFAILVVLILTLLTAVFDPTLLPTVALVDVTLALVAVTYSQVQANQRTERLRAGRETARRRRELQGRQ